MFTDGQAHPIEWFDEHLADCYAPISVSEETFAKERSRGLWVRTDIYAVQDGDERITYRYYNADGVLIRAETIPVVYNGENSVVFESDDENEWPLGSYVGELGFRNGHFYVWNGSEWVLQTTATVDDIPPVPKYLGCYTSPPETANEDDWYLNSTNGITYKFDGSEWNAVTDYDDSANTQMFMAEMSDLCALAKGTGETLFLERLCANVAFIGKLFSKNIVLQNGGTICSENYRARTSGFKIDSNGVAEFNEGNFYGTITSASGFFGGSIASGPLYVDEVNPTNAQSQAIFNKGESSERLLNYVKNIKFSECLNGTITYKSVRDSGYNTYSFSHLKLRYYKYYSSIVFYNSKLKPLKDSVDVEIEVNLGLTSADFEPWKPTTLTDTIVFNRYSPNGKTLKLIDLPTSRASRPGYVYKDSEGYLRIS